MNIGIMSELVMTSDLSRQQTVVQMVDQQESSLWIGHPAVSKVIGVGSHGTVRLPEVIHGVVVVVSTQSTQLVLVAVESQQH